VSRADITAVIVTPLAGDPRSGRTIRFSNGDVPIAKVIAGTSTNGLDAAIRNGLDRAANTLPSIGWFEVVSTRGHLE
jgi:hypothetical protein